MKKRIIAIAVILTVITLHPLLLLGAVHNEDAQFKLKLKAMGVPENRVDLIYSSVQQASHMTKIDKALILALMKTESDFNPNAKSGTGYFGLMQIPYKIFDIRKNVLIGTFILEEKIKNANGNLNVALAKYKGWKKPQEGKTQVDRVFTVYRQLKEKEIAKSTRA